MRVLANSLQNVSLQYRNMRTYKYFVIIFHYISEKDKYFTTEHIEECRQILNDVTIVP